MIRHFELWWNSIYAFVKSQPVTGKMLCWWNSTDFYSLMKKTSAFKINTHDKSEKKRNVFVKMKNIIITSWMNEVKRTDFQFYFTHNTRSIHSVIPPTTSKEYDTFYHIKLYVRYPTVFSEIVIYTVLLFLFKL